MTIHQFIEKATQGGWKPKSNIVIDAHEPQNWGQILLDPEAWKAVEEIERWGLQAYYKNSNGAAADATYGWLANMHRMIDALADGKTIEQYLETL